MSDIESPVSLDTALAFQPLSDGDLSAPVPGHFSNGPAALPPEKGFPFGGLLAALCARSMRQGLGLTAPLRTLSVQYLSAATFAEQVAFRPRLLRGGRNVIYAAVEADQNGRTTHHATGTYGLDAQTPGMSPLHSPPPPLDRLNPEATIHGPMAPHFSRHVEYRFDGGPNILGGNEGKPAVERTWMRMADRRPLDEVGLCYLLDALYPPAWTLSKTPAPMTTVDLRIDILNDPTPQNAPDGWAFFSFRMLDLGSGWTVDEATAWGADGVPLALSRQRRKLLPQRGG
ncbi:MAG: thioesterase family protein [Candidatus Brevundimonas colombiensis]|uniref:Thioesterase family protein n=1 Tax=Candidatus Brevundimonas colombiensis TaxID=3121376 RepID=A0AAJ5X244_9CAUL|nr:thioesterase family protein [Brevundimonas sp.]WEK39737.1 MAG: thioesterase family protein [Brevundimonas sp.]